MVTVCEFTPNALCILSKIMSSLFNFTYAPPESKKLEIMLKAQAENVDRLVTRDTEMYDKMFKLVSEYNAQLREHHQRALNYALESLDTRNEGEYLKMCDVLKYGYEETTSMLDTLKDYSKIISCHLCTEDEIIMIVVRD